MEINSLVYWISVCASAILGGVADIWLYRRDKKKYGEAPPSSILLLFLSGSILTGIIIGCVLSAVVYLIGSGG